MTARRWESLQKLCLSVVLGSPLTRVYDHMYRCIAVHPALPAWMLYGWLPSYRPCGVEPPSYIQGYSAVPPPLQADPEYWLRRPPALQIQSNIAGPDHT